YSDRSINYAAPDGWTKVPLNPSGDQQGGDDPVPVAVFVKSNGSQKNVIEILVAPSAGSSLEDFERSYESGLRKNDTSTFVSKKTKVTLANGMPAYWLKVTNGEEAGKYTLRYEYVISDLKRGIVAAYVGRPGSTDEKEAQAALASLAVVVYPGAR
ncbi:MAG TPA: hypothetical protein VKG44_08660, partial [Candidatus Baltobacteraceae bacterium]|nr:hypothetical protein [Candidatus Baltobacteraceae bacterium]